MTAINEFGYRPVPQVVSSEVSEPATSSSPELVRAPYVPRRVDTFGAGSAPTGLVSTPVPSEEHGTSNLEAAGQWLEMATPALLARSELVLLEDEVGAQGLASRAVIRQGERVLDPATGVSYDSLGAYLAENPQLREAGVIPANDAARLIKRNPGPDATELALSLDGVAYLQVAPRSELIADAERLHEATNPLAPFGVGTDEDAVWALLEGKNQTELAVLGAIYEKRYGTSLEDRLRSSLHGAEEQDRLLSALTAGPYYLEGNLAAAKLTPTGAAIVDEAQRQGLEVTVLPDDEYDRRHPGTSGITTDDGHIYLPVRSAWDPNDTRAISHQFLHGILADEIDLARPQEDRVKGLRAKFEQMGLDPNDGNALAEATRGWPPAMNGAAEDVAAYVLARDQEREAAGLPRESPLERQEVFREAAQRALTDTLLGRGD